MRLDFRTGKFSQLKSDLQRARSTIGFVAGIRGFLREQITPEQAKEEIKRRLDLRSESFLELARTRIYGQPAGPYRRLLQLAGCDYSDLCDHVRGHGLENTLERLAIEGVYLTSDEYKGRRAVVRGGEAFRVVPTDFTKTNHAQGIVAQSSGTSNAPVRTTMTLDRLTEKAFEDCIYFSAHGLFTYSHAVYDGILPAAGGINYLLIYAKLGVPVDRWFASKIPVNSRFEGWYHYLATHLIVLAANRSGRRVPGPEFTGISDIERILDWILATKSAGRDCCINTAASNAVRIAQVAWEKGVSLTGTKFPVRGEPFTEAKKTVITRVGASPIPSYPSNQAGMIGLGCANPLHTDEVHALEHRLALVLYPKPLAGAQAAIRPLLFTTLNPQETRLLLNVDIGDYATMETRNCGCTFNEIGFKLHLHHIRSHEKFTSEGMNYFFGDLFEFFESVLPTEFGGGPGDYQLVEEEDSDGHTRLSLIVHPAVGQLDEEKVLRRLGEALAQGSRNDRFMTKLWQDAGTFRIVRKPPHASGRGKILPLHMTRQR
jgi:hypothetical protein